jgi:hypothetical protein
MGAGLHQQIQGTPPKGEKSENGWRDLTRNIAL